MFLSHIPVSLHVTVGSPTALWPRLLGTKCWGVSKVAVGFFPLRIPSWHRWCTMPLTKGRSVSQAKENTSCIQPGHLALFVCPAWKIGPDITFNSVSVYGDQKADGRSEGAVPSIPCWDTRPRDIVSETPRKMPAVVCSKHLWPLNSAAELLKLGSYIKTADIALWKDKASKNLKRLRIASLHGNL